MNAQLLFDLVVWIRKFRRARSYMCADQEQDTFMEKGDWRRGKVQQGLKCEAKRRCKRKRTARTKDVRAEVKLSKTVETSVQEERRRMRVVAAGR